MCRALQALPMMISKDMCKWCRAYAYLPPTCMFCAVYCTHMRSRSDSLVGCVLATPHKLPHTIFGST